MPAIEVSVLREMLADVCGGDREILGDLASACAEDAGDLIAQLEAAHQADDIETLKRHAHTLKSTAATFGGTTCSESAQELEALTGTPEGADRVARESLVTRVVAEGHRFVAELEEIDSILP